MELFLASQPISLRQFAERYGINRKTLAKWVYGVQDEMNILMLLANAIELVSRQDVELRRYRGKQG